MQNFQQVILKHKKGVAIIFFVVINVINSWVSSVSIVADHTKNNALFNSWEPYCWEFSSLAMLFLLLPIIILTNTKYPLNYGRFKFNLIIHLTTTVLFSLIHSFGMVAIRKLTYQFYGSKYEFGHWPTELFYEYRKDVMTYFIIIALLYVYQLIINQLEGIASLLKNDDNSDLPIGNIDKLLIKKKGREYLINLLDVSTIEAGGNYVYIHANNQVYPMRETMLNITKKLNGKQFIRVHRSYIVNIEFVQEIIQSETGEYRILLSNKQNIPLSRKYRSSLKNTISL